MYDEAVTDINQGVTMPLPDGTVVTLTAYAKHGLTESGVKLRVKKAAAYEYIVFTPSAEMLEDFGSENVPERNINLRDWLAFWVYHCAPSFDGVGKGWRGAVTLADGNPRNLTPENFRLVWHEEPYEDSRLAPQADAECAQAAEAEAMAVEALDEMEADNKQETLTTPVKNSQETIDNQRNWLGEHFGKMRSVVGSILRERPHQADETIQRTVSELLAQIAHGTCPATHEESFILWMKGAARTAAKWKLGAIHGGVCADFDYDKSAIRLLGVMRQNAKNQIGDIDIADEPEELQRLMETPMGFDDLEGAQRERIKEEGGVWDWNRIDLDAGVEV
jgi:hypothetical protein